MIPPIASRFVAGETPTAALNHAREMNHDGVKVILNQLGEHYRDPELAAADTAAYETLVGRIADAGVDACVSVKPSQLGLDIDDDTFRSNLRAVVEAGDEHDVFVWCDMEDASTTDVTLDVYEDLAREFEGGVGLCLQANLKRTPEDIERLADVPGKIRLVKGAYDEPRRIAYKDKERVNNAFEDELERLFEVYEGGIAVGSHDPRMVDRGKELAEEHGRDVEIQMLMGVRESAQRDLAAEGYEVSQYAPYGDKWLSYFWRRIRERKENLAFALRAVVRG